MADDKIDWVRPREESFFTPIPTPGREEIEAIPIGAPMLIANMTAGGVEFSAADWNHVDKERWLNDLAPGEKFESTSLFYVDPTKIIPPLSSKVKTPDEIVNELIAEANPPETLDGMRGYLADAVRRARIGLVENPF